MTEEKLTFWEHLDELRVVLIRIVIVVTAVTVVAFAFKEPLFKIILAPHKADFILYRLINQLSSWLAWPEMSLPEFEVKLISTELTAQFFTHMKVAFFAALLLSSPYVVFILFRYISPALYHNEKKYSGTVLFWAYSLFFLGVLLSYYIIFPLSFRFLGTYQVSPEVVNTITLNSYVQTLLVLSLLMGVMFEIPVLAWFFAKIGLLKADFMRKKRRYAIVIILIVAAVITPTGDVFTLTIVSLPVFLLYEISILLVAKTSKA